MSMLNSMSGSGKTQQGFDASFNMMLPLLMEKCDSGDDACEKVNKIFSIFF